MSRFSFVVLFVQMFFIPAVFASEVVDQLKNYQNLLLSHKLIPPEGQSDTALTPRNVEEFQKRQVQLAERLQRMGALQKVASIVRKNDKTHKPQDLFVVVNEENQIVAVASDPFGKHHEKNEQARTIFFSHELRGDFGVVTMKRRGYDVFRIAVRHSDLHGRKLPQGKLRVVVGYLNNPFAFSKKDVMKYCYAYLHRAGNGQWYTSDAKDKKIGHLTVDVGRLGINTIEEICH